MLSNINFFNEIKMYYDQGRKNKSKEISSQSITN